MICIRPCNNNHEYVCSTGLILIVRRLGSCGQLESAVPHREALSALGADQIVEHYGATLSERHLEGSGKTAKGQEDGMDRQ